MLSVLPRLPRLPRPLLAALAAVFTLFLVVVPAQAASAHPAGTTGVLVTVRSDAVDVEMQIHNAGFVAATGYDIGTDQAALDAIADNLMTFILHRVSVADRVSSLAPTVTSAPAFERVNGEDAIVTTIHFTDGGRPIEGSITLEDEFIVDVVPSHQVYGLFGLPVGVMG